MKSIDANSYCSHGSARAKYKLHEVVACVGGCSNGINVFGETDMVRGWMMANTGTAVGRSELADWKDSLS